MPPCHFYLKPPPVPCYYEHLQREPPHLLMVPLGYNGHMFVWIGLSSSSLEETIASCGNMDLTLVLFMFSCSSGNLCKTIFVWFLRLFANQNCYLLLHCVLQRSSKISHIMWCRGSPSKVRETRWTVERFSHSHLHPGAFCLLTSSHHSLSISTVSYSYSLLQGSTMIRNCILVTFVTQDEYQRTLK